MLWPSPRSPLQPGCRERRETNHPGEGKRNAHGEVLQRRDRSNRLEPRGLNSFGTQRWSPAREIGSILDSGTNADDWSGLPGRLPLIWINSTEDAPRQAQRRGFLPLLLRWVQE